MKRPEQAAFLRSGGASRSVTRPTAVESTLSDANPRSNDESPAIAVRGILIGASTLTLRERGHFDGYLTHVPSALRDALAGVNPAAWTDVALAEAHYRACDALGLSDEAIEQNASSVLDRTHRATLSTLARMIGKRRLDAATVAKYLPRVWPRLFRGATIRVATDGERAVQVACARLPLLESRYFRTALGVHLQRGIGAFADGCRANLVSHGAASARFRVRWQ